MKTNILLDTNVFVYAYDQFSIFHNRCAGSFTNTNLQLYTSSKNITELVAVMTKLNFPQQEIKQTLQEIVNSIPILYPSDNSMPLFVNIVKLLQPKGNKVFDLEIASIAMANNITQIATINTSDFQNIMGIQCYIF